MSTAVEKMIQGLKQMGTPLNLGEYNRRLDYARSLGETGSVIPLSEVSESGVREVELPISHAMYRNVVNVAYAAGLLRNAHRRLQS